MLISRRVSVAALAALLLTAGCTPERDQASLFAPDAVGILVVDAALIVDQPLPAIRLSRTQPPGEPFDPLAQFEPGADVMVVTGADTIRYQAVAVAGGGLYRPLAAPPLVRPETRYELRVETTAGEVVTAATTTPRPFAIDAWVLLAPDGTTDVRELRTFAELGEDVYSAPENRLGYAEGLLDARFTGPDAAAYAAAGFHVGLFSLDPDAGYVIDPPFLEDEDFADLPRVGSSPALEADEGYVRLPWFTIYYAGRHKSKVYAVDRNWWDLIRTTPEGGGGFTFGGNAGEGVDPPLFRVEGGIGLFGSAAVDSLGFFVNPRD